MAFELLDEHEQGELVRKWIRENALSMVTGIGLGLLLIFGWQQWQAHRATRAAEAATQYLALTDALSAGHVEDVTTIAADLRKQAPKSPYAVLAAMQQAEIHSKQGDLAAAAADLDWANAQAGQASLKSLVRVRLARVKLAQDDAAGALALLDSIPGEAWAALTGELRGDALVQLGQKDAARAAYQDALSHMLAQSPGRSTLEMKIEQLPAPAVAASGDRDDKLGS